MAGTEQKKYQTIVADPPWRYTAKPTVRTGPGVSAEHLYPTMSTDAMARLRVADLAAPNAHLYMWVTNPILTEQRPTITGTLNASALARAWDFEPKALLTWIKGENGAGMGFYFRGDTEHVLFCVRGNLPIPAAIRRSNVFRGARGTHSQKPETLQDIAEQVSPGPYLEMFARRQRLGWDTWGNEALNHAEVSR